MELVRRVFLGVAPAEGEVARHDGDLMDEPESSAVLRDVLWGPLLDGVLVQGDKNHVVVTGMGDIDQPEGHKLHHGAVESERLPAHGRLPQGLTAEAQHGVGAVAGAEDLEGLRQVELQGAEDEADEGPRICVARERVQGDVRVRDALRVVSQLRGGQLHVHGGGPWSGRAPVRRRGVVADRARCREYPEALERLDEHCCISTLICLSK